MTNPIFEKLEQILDELEEEESEPHTDEERIQLVIKIKEHLEREPLVRGDYVLALGSIMALLGSALGPKATTRLANLAVELNDLDYGVVGKIVAPERKGKPPTASLERSQQVKDAAALECLVRANRADHDDPDKSLDGAARRIARSRKYSHSTVINWRNELNGGRVKNRLAQFSWNNYLKKINKVESSGGSAMLRALAEVLIKNNHD